MDDFLGGQLGALFVSEKSRGDLESAPRPDHLSAKSTPGNTRAERNVISVLVAEDRWSGMACSHLSIPYKENFLVLMYPETWPAALCLFCT